MECMVWSDASLARGPTHCITSSDLSRGQDYSLQVTRFLKVPKHFFFKLLIENRERSH